MAPDATIFGSDDGDAYGRDCTPECKILLVD
jgi:hypothetical protein